MAELDLLKSSSSHLEALALGSILTAPGLLSIDDPSVVVAGQTWCEFFRAD